VVGFTSVVVVCQPTGHRWRVLDQIAEQATIGLVQAQPLLVHGARESEGRVPSSPRSATTTRTEGLDIGERAPRVGPGSSGERRGLTGWIGVLFVVGSTGFVLGPIPAYANAVGGQASAVTFFVGSPFSIVASYLAFVQVVRQHGHSWFAWEPDDLGYWACLTQLVGTSYFNSTTFAALLDVPPDTVDRVIWRPDAIGSVCFLVASVLTFADAGHRWWSWRPGDRDCTHRAQHVGLGVLRLLRRGRPTSSPRVA
jgi:hypothetical protein